MVEHAARQAHDAHKLSIRTSPLADLLRESDYWARQHGHQVVTGPDVQRAIEQKRYRSDRIRERMLESVLRGVRYIDTGGTRIGQINGLSVLQLNDSSFGHPSRITAQVRLGSGRVIDIEREVELGGPLHAKGVMILSGFLGARYARGRPLSLTASLVFEQSYGGVEGDSASSAELYALLSAIAEVPIRQDLAVTGSVNQHGAIQPIGGVNEKIEGFFELCRERGLNGDQGVIIPRANVQHLMLRSEVVEAVATRRFHVYPVDTVDQAIELLTNLPAGALNEQGEFPEGSFNRLVNDKLATMSQLRAEFAGHPEDRNER